MLWFLWDLNYLLNLAMPFLYKNNKTLIKSPINLMYGKAPKPKILNYKFCFTGVCIKKIFNFFKLYNYEQDNY